VTKLGAGRKLGVAATPAQAYNRAWSHFCKTIYITYSMDYGAGWVCVQVRLEAAAVINGGGSVGRGRQESSGRCRRILQQSQNICTRYQSQSHVSAAAVCLSVCLSVCDIAATAACVRAHNSKSALQSV